MAEQQPAIIEAYYSTFGCWFESRLYPAPTGLTVYFQDITERKKSEALLKGRRDVLEMIAQGAPLENTLEKLLQVIEAHSPEMWCSILLLDVDGQHLRHGAAPRLPGEFVRTFDGLAISPALGSCGTAAFRREPVVVEDIATDPLWADYRDLALTHGLHACWSTPIFDAKQRVLGTFAIYYRQAGPPKGEHQELIEMATHIAAVAISRQRTEEETRNLNQRLTQATAVAAIGIWDWDIAADRWYATPTYFTILGYQPEPGVSFREFWMKKIHPEDQAAVEAKIESVLSGRNYSYQYEARMLHADGSYHWIKVVGRAIATDAQGKALRLIGVRIDITDLKCTEEELRMVEQQLHTLVGRLHTAREEEAKRIARELHDDLGQRLTALNMELDRLETKLPAMPADSKGQLSRMHQAVDQMIEVVQKISGELRIGHLDVLGLPAAIEWQVRDFARRSGLAAVSTRLDEGVELPDIQATALFRVMQEALTNVARHAGATRVEVSLQNSAGLVTLTIRDNGRGITSAELADRQAIGLLGMRERVQLVGGTLAIRGEAGQGTTVVVTIRASPPRAAPV
jgi:PAS domain S-box-containing protein